MNRYPDKPPDASDGEAFAELCVRLHLDLMSEDVGYYRTALDQLTRGESAAGVEFKHLQKSYTGRLHIEVAERTSLTTRWFPSGIFAYENMKRYCCGNEDDVWIFDVNDLRKLAVSNATDWFSHPTIHSMVLHKSVALSFYLYRFERNDEGYVLIRQPTEAERAGHTNGFVGYDKDGHFVHYCHCGKWGAFSVGASLLRNQLGTWYCLEHRPPPAPVPTPAPVPIQETTPAPLTPTQGTLF